MAKEGIMTWEQLEKAQSDPYHCPKCGDKLVLKMAGWRDHYRQFMGCPRYPLCKYTKSLSNLPKPFCAKCNNTGLLPFIKNSKTIPNVWLDCECRIRESEDEHYAPIEPEDFDFPCSDTFRGYYAQTHGHRDPGYYPLETATVVECDRQDPWERMEHFATKDKRLDKLQGELIAMRDTLSKHIKPKKKVKSESKGIEL